ncbi:MAG: Sec-independent protein translocase TatA [Zetaproteobacteria bacterium CG2_30_46_52]|nr:MAG: Sec-independent protein translocase TatA [Zetaproteobacteria bacterium CG2_30_46_52]
MFGLGTTELMLILVIVVVLFGAKKLPALGEGLAKGIKSFRTNMSDDKSKAADDQIIEVEKEKNKSA